MTYLTCQWLRSCDYERAVLVVFKQDRHAQTRYAMPLRLTSEECDSLGS